MDVGYGKNRSQEIRALLLNENRNGIEVMERMLCDLVENAKREKEELWASGKLEGIMEGKLEGKLEEKVEIARAMLCEKLPVDLIIRITNLQKEDIEALKV